MRLLTRAAVAATTVLGAGVAAVAAGRGAAAAALRPARAGPARLPAGFAGPQLTVHSFSEGNSGTGETSGTEGWIALTRSFTARLPGRYGLSGRGCHVVVGPVLGEAAGNPGATSEGAAEADTAVRRLERITHGSLAPGTKLRLTPLVHLGNPRDALGLDYAEVEIPGETGALPAWFLPGERDTWVITVHGLGSTREQPMSVLPFLHGQHLPVLDLAYRGDPGTPGGANGPGALGAREWRDVDAAMRYALGYGAERFVLHGWSTGATMALHAAARSTLRDRVSGLVLDSPVLDRRTTLRALAASRGVPDALLPLAVRAAEGRIGLDNAQEPPPELADPAGLSVPILLFHGPDDTVAPWESSRRLAARHPDLITLHVVPHAPHAAMWNADPAGYEETVRRFLTPLL
ncbi:hypothetical protein LHJ74_28395 [Streptomyces sp. N2-109]|uniref:Secreted protein n=1 Tax=Streptomyces gossypii TaxID=2883101 RepID=A0ABT2K2B9_9ACTN|nr:hypothetical protein [Streptomyces gossypii]MCT2593779.1 hypothetical protein [Streptomyces gossypii]